MLIFRVAFRSLPEILSKQFEWFAGGKKSHSSGTRIKLCFDVCYG